MESSGDNIETRSLAWFLQNRAVQRDLEVRQEQRRERLEVKREQEQQRRKALQKSKKQREDRNHYDSLNRAQSFLDHAHKSLASVLKIQHQIPPETRDDKDVRLTLSLLDNVKKLQNSIKSKIKEADRKEGSDQ